MSWPGRWRYWDGVHSLLEYRVRARRGAAARPAGRQARAQRGYLDNLYEEYQVCVELDGRAAHPDDRRWQDIHRDNAAAAEGQVTLRYSWADIARRACPTGWEVGTTLLQRGWPGPIRPFPHCPGALRVAEPRFQKILESWVRYMTKRLQDHPRWVQWCTGGATDGGEWADD